MRQIYGATTDQNIPSVWLTAAQSSDFGRFFDFGREECCCMFAIAKTDGDVSTTSIKDFVF